MEEPSSGSWSKEETGKPTRAQKTPGYLESLSDSLMAREGPRDLAPTTT